MTIWRICRAKFAGEAFSGVGARRFGGRWNSPGVPMVYASSSLALAAMQPDDLVAIAAMLPKGEPAQQLEPGKLPRGWWKNEFGPLRAIGDKWIEGKSSLAISVPSAALRTEWNVLVNPLHPAVREIKIEKPQPFRFDERMFR